MSVNQASHIFQAIRSGIIWLLLVQSEGRSRPLYLAIEGFDLGFALAALKSACFVIELGPPDAFPAYFWILFACQAVQLTF